MEPGFKASLNEIKELAKKDRPDGLEAVNDELERMIERQAELRGLKPESERQIFYLQQEKQRIMRWLRGKLKDIDTPGRVERYDPDSRRILYDGTDYLWQKTDGSKSRVTLGMLMTDGVWDVNYVLDPETVPRKIRRKFLVEKAKRLLQRELDKQIAIDKQQSDMTNPRYRGGYNGLLKDRVALSQQGHLAERMVYSFLRKLTIDESLPFEIEASNVFEDIELSIDFIIKIKTARRGVAVEGTDDDQTIGVQFSIAKKRARKKKKLEGAKDRAKASGVKIDDIVLVRVRLKQLTDMFAAWSVNKPPGGPDELWEPEVKWQILRGVLKGLFSEKEIEEMRSKVVSTNPFQKQT